LATRQVAEKGLATDGHGWTRIETKAFICVHPCESVAEIESFSILPGIILPVRRRSKAIELAAIRTPA
jgi:hypothetical protein